ncbi:MAG: RecX family transcriptional regulator [Candidatus Saccharimonadales bacterium]
MKITAIKQQVKQKSRYSIFVDDEYAFSLGSDALLDAQLSIGREIDESELAAFKKLSSDDKAYGLTLAYIARRMRSEGELRDYFRRKEYDEGLVDQLLERLKKSKWIDDVDFAERWVENRRQLKQSSTKKIRLELRQKHVASDIIDNVLGHQEEDEHKALKLLIEKKRRQTRYQDNQKLMAYLARQGFAYGDIKTALHDGD